MNDQQGIHTKGMHRALNHGAMHRALCGAPYLGAKTAMTNIELNGLDELCNWLDVRDLYQRAYFMSMIKRDRDAVEGEAPNTYLGLAVTAPDLGGRFGAEKPSVVGATALPVALAGSAWSTEVVGDELPYGVDIEEVGALGGAGGVREIANEPLHDREVTEAVQGGAKEHSRGE